MNSLDHRRALLDLAYQLDRGEDLSEEQKKFLAFAIYRVATGENANKVFQTQLRRGEKLSALIDRRRMSMILHWVACQVYSDPNSSRKAMSVEEACYLAEELVTSKAKKAFPGADNRKYSGDYLLRCWSDPANAHLRSPDRSWLDPDFPYYPIEGDTK
ncbi:MAG: hypothetical protein FJY37_18480 [Betaproteobacteria bacterium]|nr:hypothetical protein [Betaproteobacteria bacterium]